VDGLNGNSSDECSSQQFSKLFQCRHKVRYSRGHTVVSGMNLLKPVTLDSNSMAKNGDPKGRGTVDVIYSLV
jgi:hypothetical protein